MSPLQRAHRNALEASNAARELTFRAAIDRSMAEIAADPSAVAPYRRLARQLRDTGQADEALDVLRQGMRDAVVDAAFVRRVAVDLLDAGHGEEALAVLDATAPRFPLDAELVLLRRLAFPSVFRDAGEPARWRERLSRGLASLSLDDPELAALPHAALIDATLRFNPYYVDYLGDVSRDLHDAWGDWLARLLSASASTGAAPMEGATPAPRAADSRIRIGIVGDTLRAHVVSELFVGWATALDRTRFDLRCYALHSESDRMSQAFEAASSRFVESPDTAVLRAAIVEDQPRVLLYLAVGMSSAVLELAAQRLAPVQCAAWGHPRTTGLPTIDYFLGSDAMEPPGAAAHYRERLVRLPGLGTTFRLPDALRPLHINRRADFGLCDDDVVLLCAQNVSKFLPSFDTVLIDIARRLPASRFVFAVGHQRGGTVLRQRIARAFEHAGLDWSRHEIALPELTPLEFDNLVCVADALLDPDGWSAGYTAVNAVAFGLPIVCRPGAVARTRQSAAILTLLGETRTIAASASAYVEIVERIAHDTAFVASVRASLTAPERRERLASDPRAQAALQAFLESAVSRGTAGADACAPAV